MFEPESFAPMGKLCGDEVQSIVCDYLGTPVLVLDAQGQPVWSAAISAWGEPRELQGERFACPFRWPGQYEDVETGLYYNRFRYYDAESGQYVSQDPIGLRGSRALYSYVGDPLAKIDPLGLAACNKEFGTRAQAYEAAHERAGIQKGLRPDAVWEVGADSTRRGMPGYRYSDEAGSHGHYMQFETERGSRLIAEHVNDGAPHFHAGQPKIDPTRSAVNFGWDSSTTTERYQAVGGGHHYYYPRGHQ